jgi:hypothetical protein
VSGGNEPLLPATIEVDLDDVTMQQDNSFRIWVRFEESSYLALDIPPDSDGHREIVEALSDIISVRLGRLGEHGVVITGLTSHEDEDEVSAS